MEYNEKASGNPEAFFNLKCVSEPSGSFLDLAGFQTGRANFDSFYFALYLSPNRVEIRVESSLIHIMGMRYCRTEQRFFAAYVTNFCHS